MICKAAQVWNGTHSQHANSFSCFSKRKQSTENMLSLQVWLSSYTSACNCAVQWTFYWLTGINYISCAFHFIKLSSGDKPRVITYTHTQHSQVPLIAQGGDHSHRLIDSFELIYLAAWQIRSVWVVLDLQGVETSWFYPHHWSCVEVVRNLSPHSLLM